MPEPNYVHEPVHGQQWDTDIQGLINESGDKDVFLSDPRQHFDTCFWVACWGDHQCAQDETCTDGLCKPLQEESHLVWFRT